MENKKKIAFVVYSLSNGGLGRVVANSTFMFTKMGFEVHLYVVNSHIDFPYQAVLHSFKSNLSSNVGKIKVYYKIYKSIRKNNFDLIIDHRYKLSFISEVFWQKIIYSNQKVINYIHSSFLGSYLFNSINKNKFLFKDRLFICVSKGIESKVNQRFPILKTISIYNFISITNEDSFQINQPYIITVGRLDISNVKQIDVLLYCYAKSILPIKGIKLVVIGDGVLKNDLVSLAKKLNIEDLVEFKGFLPNPYPYIKNALFTTLTSKYEGLPTILIESLMLGTPVVAYDCDSGPKEIIQHEINGLLVENQNNESFVSEMNRLITDEDLYQKIKSNTVQSASLFSNQNILKEWKKLLNGIL